MAPAAGPGLGKREERLRGAPRDGGGTWRATTKRQEKPTFLKQVLQDAKGDLIVIVSRWPDRVTPGEASDARARATPAGPAHITPGPVLLLVSIFGFTASATAQRCDATCAASRADWWQVGRHGARNWAAPRRATHLLALGMDLTSECCCCLRRPRRLLGFPYCNIWPW